MGKKVNTGKYDNIFRSVFDSWRKNRQTINGIRKDFKITEDTIILLSGSAGEIHYIDDFIREHRFKNRVFESIKKLKFPQILNLTH